VREGWRERVGVNCNHFFKEGIVTRWQWQYSLFTSVASEHS